MTEQFKNFTIDNLEVKGKVFIEYAHIEAAWVPVNGDNFYT